MSELKFRAFQDNAMLMQNEYGVYGAKKFLDKLYQDAEVMQYVGLRDKNGKEVYEGDLLHNRHDENYCYPILWNRERAGFGLGEDDVNLNPYQIPVFWEVIGNIYENPELLNGLQSKQKN
jgi:hypothetical protein